MKNKILLVAISLFYFSSYSQERFLENDLAGLKDQNGKIIVKPKYDIILDFKNGYAITQLNKKYGYINKSGIEICVPKYDDAYNFKTHFYGDNVYASIKLNGYWGMINTLGQEVLDTKYQKEIDFSSERSDSKHFAQIENYDDPTGKYVRYGLIDDFFKLVIVDKYNFIKFMEYAYTLIGIRDSNGNLIYGLLDKNFKELFPVKYTKIQFINKDLLYVSIGDKYYLYTSTAKRISNFEYESIFNVKRVNLAEVKRNGKYGYVDSSGQEKIPCIYDNVDIFNNGKLKVTLNGREFYIDANGNEIN